MSSPSIALSPLELKTPTCEKGIGKVIVAPDSKDLIVGVRAASYSVWPDDRGYFLEVVRMGQGLPEAFPKDTTQVSAALNYPGTVKGIPLPSSTNGLLGSGARYAAGGVGGLTREFPNVWRAKHDLSWGATPVSSY